MDEAALQHADSVQQMFASLAAMMHEQQQFMAQTAELQRQMAATLQQQQQQQSTSQQQQPSVADSSSPDTREYRAEGITMPKFSGTKDDDVADYLFSAKLYFESKNIKYGADSPQQRPLSLLVANLKGPAAAWYREYVSHDGNFLHSVTLFEELLTSELTTPDRQEHLRDQLIRLRQNNFTCLEDYVAAFRHIICKVEEMSDIDKVMHFQKGLVVEIKQEVKLRQFRNTTDAISFALMYDRTHAVGSRRTNVNRGGQGPQRLQQSSHHVEEPTPMEIGSSRFVSREECLRSNLCFYCKEPGHRLATCPKRPARNNPRGSSRPPQGRGSFRANQGSSRRIVEDDDVSGDDDDAYADNRDDHVEVIDSLQLNMSLDAKLSPNRELLRFKGAMIGQAVRVLIDSGAERNIVRPGLAQHYVEATKVTAERFDGTTTPARTAQQWLETVCFDGRAFNDVSLIEWEVSSNQDVILGLPWLVQFNPIINWQTGVMRFPNQRVVHDFDSVNSSLEVAGPTVASVEVKPEFLQHPLPPNLRKQLGDRVKAGYFSMPLGPSSLAALEHQTLPRIFGDEGDDGTDASPLCVLADAEFEKKVKADEYVELYHVTVKTSPKVKSVPLQLQAVLEEFADVFPAELPPGLPPSRSIEHEVVLKPGSTPSNRSPFPLSKVEQEALDIFVAELLKKNWVEVSDSPWVSNIFGVPKKDPATGKFPSRLEWLHSNNPHMPIRWVIDYRLVNAASDVAKIPVPHIEQLFDRMVGAVVFSILDLASGYHQMRMSPTSKQYTAFRTNHEIYHWNVAPMGLASIPGTWTRLMRKLLSHLLFVVVYLDDICIFSRSMADHVEHLRQVCEVLRANKLYARPDKCDFGQASVDFLGHTISADGLHVDARKTRAIAEWTEPCNIKDLQRFLGLAGYYRRLIHQFATLVLPLSSLVKKDVAWVWNEHQRQAFNAIKLALQHAPVLRLPDFKKTFIVTTDASHACIGGVLSQMHGGNDLPVAFFSKKLGPHELNWPVHEKELFAIKQALTRWRRYLHGVSFEVYTDNSACK
ncbi:hypothetical protein PF001_g28270 [Phytophthora fragariae]|uniref:CCHC-type domain-containing protein n=6 Tax=Phytophthora fragariae TaxID=53985 RepID=A0A6A4BFF7_9STRA|nr:hypothetical protein PF001_g28270 [Phytophthora fragariae]